jgi:transglutaminase-like putative cysteine protease
MFIGKSITVTYFHGINGIMNTKDYVVLAAGSKIPAVVAQQSEVSIFSNNKAVIDASNLAEGYLLIRYTGGKAVPIKVQITKKDGITYTYNLDAAGTPEIYPLTEGDGTYTVNVMENVGGTRYSLAYGHTFKLTLRNGFLPFLYPNQYVNYSSTSATITQAKALVAGTKNDLEKLDAIYQFVVKNFKYDYESAKNVPTNYIPKLDVILSQKKGICFDYASIACAMLRSQGIPSKLVIGYAGTAYHAWINVYIETVGWIDKAIYFDGEKFSLMDPTFASGNNSNPEIYKYIGDGSNYSPKYVR